MHDGQESLSGLLSCGKIVLTAALMCLASITAAKAADTRVFEMRTYTAHPGKLADLHKRFREHTNRIFVKHGMSLIGYWTPSEGPEAENTLVYILAYPSQQARDAAWEAFRKDPEWNKAREESEREGKIVEKVESQFLHATDYSPIQ